MPSRTLVTDMAREMEVQRNLLPTLPTTTTLASTTPTVSIIPHVTLVSSRTRVRCLSLSPWNFFHILPRRRPCITWSLSLTFSHIATHI